MSAVALYVYGGGDLKFTGMEGIYPPDFGKFTLFSCSFQPLLNNFGPLSHLTPDHTKDLHSWFIHMCDQRFFKIYPNKDASFWRKDTSNRNLVQFCSQILPLNIEVLLNL